MRETKINKERGELLLNLKALVGPTWGTREHGGDHLGRHIAVVGPTWGTRKHGGDHLGAPESGGGAPVEEVRRYNVHWGARKRRGEEVKKLKWLTSEVCSNHEETFIQRKLEGEDWDAQPCCTSFELFDKRTLGKMKLEYEGKNQICLALKSYFCEAETNKQVSKGGPSLKTH